MRTIDIATCCLAGFVAAACSPDPDEHPDASGPPPPASCAEIKARNPAATSGATTIYLGGDPARGVPIYCDDMGTDSPVEYLDLPDNIDDDLGGRPANVSVVYINIEPTEPAPENEEDPNSPIVDPDEPSQHVVLNVQFDMVRLDISDPLAPAIDLGDTRHTVVERVGIEDEDAFVFSLLSGADPISDIAFGTAVLCRVDYAGNTLRTGIEREANIDLNHTPFVLDVSTSPAPSMFVTTAEDSVVFIDSERKTATLTPINAGVSGHCNWVMPRVHSTPLINPESGRAGKLPLRYDLPTEE